MTAELDNAVLPPDNYDLASFAHDDTPRFMELIAYLPPRDSEIILCFALLGKRPTDLSILFGKAGHRAEDDLQKAAHKLAGLIEFGESPDIGRIQRILQRRKRGALAAQVLQYARRQSVPRSVRPRLQRVIKTLYAADDREECLLAGWILWLIDGYDSRRRGWRQRTRSGTAYRLGPTVFRAEPGLAKREGDRWTEGGRIAEHGGKGMGRNPHTGKIARKLKFLLRGM